MTPLPQSNGEKPSEAITKDAAPATAESTKPTPREGYHEATASIVLRKNRTPLQGRTVTIVPPPPPKPLHGKTPHNTPSNKTTPSKEVDNPNVFEKMFVTPIKGLIDEISRHGQSKHGPKNESKNESKNKQDKNKDNKSKKEMSARERVEKITMSPVPEKKKESWEKVPIAAEVLFVHGACASSKQFDRLLGSVCDSIRGLDSKEGAGAEGGVDEKSKERKEKWSSMGGAIRCHLFDALGCGESKPADPAGSNSWDAFAPDELEKDLAEVLRSVAAEGSGKEGDDSKPPPIFIVAHSYGTSQVIRLLTDNNNGSSGKDEEPLLPPSVKSRIAGLILISGALSGGPSDVASEPTVCSSLPCSGSARGTFCLPVFCLQPFRAKMDDAFIEKAVHPDAPEGVRDECRTVCENNDLAYCKAFYRQARWATVEDARRVETKALVIHGQDDGVIVRGGGEHLNDMLPNSEEFMVVPDASHQVMQERPAAVADLMLDFIEGRIAP